MREEVFFETNVFTRLAEAPDSARVKSLHFRKEGSLEYHDLRLKKSEELQIVRFEERTDGVRFGSYGKVNRVYDDEGRLAQEILEIESSISPWDEDGVRRREDYCARRSIRSPPLEAERCIHRCR